MMRILPDWQDLVSSLVKHNHNISKSCTNFFPNQEQYQVLIKGGKISVLDTRSTLWIIRQDRGFQHLYYTSTDLQSLASEFASITPYLSIPTTLTLIGRENSFDKLDEFLRGLEFRQYSEYQRMGNRISGNHFELTCPESAIRAVLADAITIERLFIESFDPLDDEIPSLEEIYSYIDRNLAMVIKVNGILAGCLITNFIGKTSQFIYIAVQDKFRGQGVASRLMEQYLSDCIGKDVIRSLLWVRNNNLSAIAYYKKYNYLEEGLRKRVYLYKELP